eukprot:2574425-Rhodomonas_salina.1
MLVALVAKRLGRAYDTNLFLVFLELPTVTVTDSSRPTPDAGIADIDVSDSHEDASNAVPPRYTLGVRSTLPNKIPPTVMLTESDAVATLDGFETCGDTGVTQ